MLPCSRQEREVSIQMTDGQAALERGDWQHAKQAFELSLQQGDDPEALEGLGLAAWWLDLAVLLTASFG